MSPRSIRRAAERKAAKLARKAAGVAEQSHLDQSSPQSSTHPQPEPNRELVEQALSPAAISPAQLAANRANAQLSTGPRTAAGKSKSCMNNFKHGFRGEFCVLPTESQVEFDELLAAFREEHQPTRDSQRRNRRRANDQTSLTQPPRRASAG